MRLVNRHQQKSNFRFFRYFFVGFRFFRFFNTDVGVGFGFFKYRDIGFGFRLPTRLYHALVHILRRRLSVCYGTKVCRYNWHSAGSMGWPFPMLKYKYIFQIKYTEAILSNSAQKLLWFEITKMLIAVLKINCVIYYNCRHTSVPYVCPATAFKSIIKSHQKTQMKIACPY